ncbi:MAP/microtubule affinity-regulating kinase 4 [Entomophthora muscae]|uniref:MAP/microtubule affinity-regulating kinase 4 n=2 Tax=Entomophthora muscae TaxID=34485 RepID=A0ACC2TJB4_9FUNG|nr:MAP/microtubule affinity-regulating kinase 4 [Entomophthora muscae]
MMDLMDHIEIDPRYPGRSQTKLLSKVIRSSQYEAQPQTYRSSIYRQLNSEAGKSISRKSKYQVGVSDSVDTANRDRPNSNRRSKYQASEGLSVPHSVPTQNRTSYYERQSQSARRSKYQVGVAPIAIPTSPNSIPKPVREPSGPERQSRRSKYSPSCSPDTKHLSEHMRARPSSTVNSKQPPEGGYQTSHTDESPEENDESSMLSDGAKDDEDFLLSPNPSKPLTEVGDYIVKRDIGQGTFGIVKLGEHRVTKQKVAIKVITKSSIKNSRARARVEQELRLLPLLEHPHIVKVYDVIEDEERFMIVMEHLSGGELFQYIVKNRRVNEREGRFFFRQILSALDYCHQNSVIHRDMKPENLLFDSKMQIRLIDFGFANFYQTDQTLSTFCGSPYYASPEMIRGVDYIGPEVDIWSLGVTLYTMLSGKLPFNAYNLKSFQRKVTRGEYEMPVYFSREVSDLIRGMLNTDRRRRLTMEQIRLHTWTNAGYSDLPNSFLTIRPPTVRCPDPEIIRLMVPYGFGEEESRATLMTNNKPIQPIFNLYHLLETRRQTKAKDQIRNKRILQKSNTISVPSTTPSVPRSSQNSPTSISECDEQQMTIRSRRYSVDTMRDEDFEGDVPLAQTMLKAAGRSFDSISRRCSVQSKLRPVGMPSKLNRQYEDDEPTSPRGELGNGLLLGKEPKDGWFIGLFNVSVTSNKPHQQIVQELERVLNNLQIVYQETESRFVCHSQHNKLSFEVRILWKDSVKAFVVQFKNLKGSSWAHKKYCYKIIQRMFI